MLVFVLNKNKESRSIWLSTKNTGTFRSFEKWTFGGTGEFDANAEFKLGSDGKVQESVAETTVPPLSITIMRMELNNDEPNSTGFRAVMDEGFSICPNPVCNKITIIMGKEGQETTANISDIFGKVVMRNKTDQSSMVDVSNLTPGVYLIHLFLNNEHRVQKFIKQ